MLLSSPISPVPFTSLYVSQSFLIFFFRPSPNGLWVSASFLYPEGIAAYYQDGLGSLLSHLWPQATRKPQRRQTALLWEVVGAGEEIRVTGDWESEDPSPSPISATSGRVTFIQMCNLVNLSFFIWKMNNHMEALHNYVNNNNHASLLSPWRWTYRVCLWWHTLYILNAKYMYRNTISAVWSHLD